jgi:hypothetical protein
MSPKKADWERQTGEAYMLSLSYSTGLTFTYENEWESPNGFGVVNANRKRGLDRLRFPFILQDAVA